MTRDGNGPVLPGEIADDLAHLADAYSLGRIHQARYLAEGLMNRNWRIETDRGVFALKQIVDVPVPKARRSLSVLDSLDARGLPVCPPRRSSSADVVVEVGGRHYCLLPWAAGTHRQGADLAPEEASTLGALLGRIHTSLASPKAGLPAPADVSRAKVTAPEAAVAEADRFLEVIGRIEDPGAFDLAAASAVERRKVLIAEHAALRPASELPRGPVGWTHGDFQPLNVLWDGSAVSAVLDWDRLGVRPYAEEVVRTAQVSFGVDDGRLDLRLVAAFAAGYRSAVPVSDEDLADAIQRLWWKRMTDFWQLQWHYDKDDHGPDDLWVSGERLLGWWTGARGEVLDAFATRS